MKKFLLVGLLFTGLFFSNVVNAAKTVKMATLAAAITNGDPDDVVAFLGSEAISVTPPLKLLFNNYKKNKNGEDNPKYDDKRKTRTPGVDDFDTLVSKAKKLGGDEFGWKTVDKDAEAALKIEALAEKGSEDSWGYKTALEAQKSEEGKKAARKLAQVLQDAADGKLKA